MINATDYISAIQALADSGIERDILFSAISDDVAFEVANLAKNDATFRASVIKANERSGLVDTYVVSACG